MISRAKKLALFLLGFLFFANILAWIAVFEFSKPKVLEDCFFDVGQGDAIFIETPERHPTKEVLQRLEKFDINVLRTDETGDIKVISDGNNLKINFEK